MKARVNAIVIVFMLPALIFAYITVGGDVSGETWQKDTYLVESHVTVATGDTLWIEAGSVIKFTNDTWLKAYGSLIAIGSETDSIYFTSIFDDSVGESIDSTNTDPDAADWVYIEVQEGGYFDYCDIRYSGNFSALKFYNADSGYFNHSRISNTTSKGLYVTFNEKEIDIIESSFIGCPGIALSGLHAKLNVQDCIFEGNSVGVNNFYGDTKINNCQFYDNIYYPVSISEQVLRNYSNNRGGGSQNNVFYIGGYVEKEDVLLNRDTCGFPFIVIDDICVKEGFTMTISPGEVLKFGSEGHMKVYGTLFAQGTEVDSIVFTSLKDDRYEGDSNNDGTTTMPDFGDWGYLEVYKGEVYLDYMKILYSDNGLCLYDSDTSYFGHGEIKYSDHYGIHCIDSSPVIRHSNIHDNDEYGVYVTGSSHPDFGQNNNDGGYNSFVGNDENGIQFRNSSNNGIPAYYNNWGYNNSSEISQHIDDAYSGKVHFDPWIYYVSSVDDPLAIPVETDLMPNYPNPFNPITSINYQLAEYGLVNITVRNLNGQLIETLINSEQEPGIYSLRFQVGNLPSGIYLYSLEVGSILKTRKMIVLK